MEQSYKQKFYDKYMKEVLPQIILLEPIRKKKCLKFCFVFIVYLILQVLHLFVIFYLILYLLSNRGYNPLLSLLFIIMALLTFICLPLFKNLRNRMKIFKQEVKAKFLQLFISVFPNLQYCSDSASITLYKDSNLFGEFNQIEYDDTFSGIYSQVKFMVNEVKLNSLSSSSKGGTNCKNVFKGIVICFDNNKNSEVLTIVTTRNDKSIKNRKNLLTLLGSIPFAIYALLAFIYHEWGMLFICLACTAPFIFITFYKANSVELSNVYLEDPEFDKEFCVQSQNQIEARYLVTTAFMDRLKNIQTAFGTKNIKCAFFDDKIMFAISTNKDLFEIGNLFTPMTSSKYINEFFNQIMSIYEMIDHFKLNEKTGL